MIDPEALKFQSLPSVSLSERSSLPEVPCIYFVIISQGIIQYIGRTNNLRRRWQEHHRLSQLEELPSIRIAWLEVRESESLPAVEKALIEWFKPYLNQTSVERRTKTGPGRGRPGGNPDFGKKYKFDYGNEEKRSIPLTIRVSESLLKQIKEAGGDNFRDFCRDAIIKELRRISLSD